MAVTVNKVCDVNAFGTERAAIFTVADTSYATGGSVVVFPGFENPKFVEGNYAGRPVVWDRAAQKLLAYASAATEVSSTTALVAATSLVVGN